MLKKLYIVILIVTTFFLSANSKDFTLNIIHMNDIHSHLDEETMSLTFDGKKLHTKVGGYPRVATLIKEKIKKYKNTLLLNAGDALQGTLYYTIFKGDIDAKMMNTLPWDAFVLGNHEFDDGDINLNNFISKIKVPIIAANVYADKNDILFNKWKSYIIKDFDSKKVGIIGIDTLNATKYSSNPSKNIKFEDEVKTVKKYVKKLKSIGVNKIILLDHYGYVNDIKLASEVKDIDVIVGGHSHTLMGDFGFLGLKSNIPYPKIIVSPKGDKTCIVQAYAYGKVVGDLKVVFDKSGKVLTCKGTPILALSDNFKIKNSNSHYVEVDEALKEKIKKFINKNDNIKIIKKDVSIQAILDKYKKTLDKKETQIIGYAMQTIYNIRIPGEHYGIDKGINLPQGSEVVPIVAKSFYERVKNSDAVILNAGAVRTNIKKGGISIKDAYTLLPFSNTLYSIPLSGVNVHQIIEDALDSVIVRNSSGSFPYAYGLRYDIDMLKIKGKRVQNIEILDKQSYKFQKIKKEKIYNITTISYLASGKDGYDTFAGVKGKDTYFDYANSFVVYIEKINNQGKKIKKLSYNNGCIKSYCSGLI